MPVKVCPHGRPAYCEVCELTAEVKALRAFKTWVHSWLDEQGIPTDPDPKRTEATGCRIGTRLDYLKTFKIDMKVLWENINRTIDIVQPDGHVHQGYIYSVSRGPINLRGPLIEIPDIVITIRVTSEGEG